MSKMGMKFDPHREAARELRRLGMATTESLAHTRLYLDGRQVHGPAEDIAALELVLDKREGTLRRRG